MPPYIEGVRIGVDDSDGARTVRILKAPDNVMFAWDLLAEFWSGGLPFVTVDRQTATITMRDDFGHTVVYQPELGEMTMTDDGYALPAYDGDPYPANCLARRVGPGVD